MEKKLRYTLGKTERLKSRKQIERLFAEGKTLSVFPFRVLYILKKDDLISDSDQRGTLPTLQAGFTVSSRHFKSAVKRNRIKRLMREAWRLQKNKLQLLPDFHKITLTLFFIYIGKELPEYALIYEKMTSVIKRLIKLTGENR
ncbi:MAG: ribonuclease P protein component [Ferruginibacter sp.]